MKTALRQNTFMMMGSLFHNARQYLDQQFKPYGLSRNEWLVLALLRLSDNALSQNFAKSHLAIENSYFTKVLNALEEKQFIVREIDPQDRRNRIIKVNPASAHKVQAIFTIIHDLNIAIQQDLNEAELTALHHALTSIDKRLSALITKE